MPTPFVADAADEAVRSNTILNERKATDIIEETALEVDIRAWRAEGLRLLQAASAREDKVPNGARRPCSVLGDASAQAAIEDAVTRMSRTEGVPQRPPRALGSTLAPEPEPPSVPVWSQRSSGQAMPPKNRKSAAFSKVHRCQRLAAAATQMQAARQSVELLVVFARSRVLS